ncbi:MAG: BatD family protein [bacterium]
MTRRIKNIISIVFLFCVVAAVGQDNIEFVASSKPVVAVGETFTLSFTLNAQGTAFRLPNFQGFNVLSGPNTSTTSSIRSVSGRTSMTIAYTYTYYLQASREGSFEIPAASVNVNGKNYNSNTLTIKVVKNPNGTASQQGSGTQRQPGGDSRQPNQVVSGPNDVFIKATASKSDPIQGEGIVVAYKIYTKVPIAQINISKLSSFSGFWSQNLIKENDKLQQTTQVIDGQQYVVADIRKIALFPLKSGQLVIDPLQLECVAQVKRASRSRTGDPFFDDFFNDPFFNTGTTNIEKSLTSNALVINVKPLPESGKPADFSGAVGSFTFNSEIDKSRLKANEALNLKYVISGKGNIQLIDKLNVTFPPDFETYDPKITSDVKSSGAGISGSQTFEYLIIPRKPGKFTIKPFNFSYFDLDKRKYVTLSSPEYTIDVDKGTGEAAAVTYSGANKEDIKYIGSDIRHIKDKSFVVTRLGNWFIGSTGFWLLLLIPLILFIMVIILGRRLSARRSDTILMKNLKATKVARKRLRKAEVFQKSGKQEEFYVEISQALWGYLSDKFSIPMADLSIDSVHEALVKKSVNEEMIRQFIETLNNTEFARFAPGEKSVNMERIYNEALEIISKIERELR